MALDVTPGTWTMEAGARLTLSAVATGVDPSCSISWLNIAWSLPGISVNDGFLNSSLGPTVTFAAFGGASGPALVAASGSGIASCSGTPYSIAPSGSATVSIVPPLVLDGLEAGPNPAPVGQTVALAAVVHGGLPPYGLAIDFGDGTHGTEAVAEPGTIVIDHTYTAGRYSPTWNVTDALRATASASPITPVVVADSLAVVVDGPSQVDSGVTATLTANVSGGVPPYTFAWSDLEGRQGYGASLTATYSVLGRQTVSVWVTDSGAASASASRTLVVAAAPSIAVDPSAPTGDVDRAVPFALNVSSGTPPYRVTWSEVGGAANGTVELGTNGWYLEPVVPSLAGALWISASIVDADGISGSAAADVAEVYALPSLTLAPTSPLAEVGAPVLWGGVVSGGAPPVLWSAAASLPVNASTSSGRMDGPGTFTWTTVPAAPGNLTVQLTATDATGSLVDGAATVRVEPATTVRLAAPVFGGSGSPTTISAYVAGGDPPYAYSVDLSDGERFTGNLSGSGPVAWTVTPRTAGFLDLTVSVTDALAVTSTASVTAVVPGTGAAAAAPIAPAAGGAPAAWTAWAGAGAGVIALVAWWVVPKRLRRKPPTSTRSRAMRLVRTYLEGATGLDRTTLQFLGEDDELSTRDVDDALAQWVRLGRVSAQVSDDRDEEFHWGPRVPAPEPPGRDPNEELP